MAVIFEKMRLKRTLIDRLCRKGIELTMIPGFLRSLANSIFASSPVTLWQVNQKLRYLGWDELELDQYTLELALACFEHEGLSCLENIGAQRFHSYLPPASGNMLPAAA